MNGRQAVGLVAQREIRERVREKSFLVSTGVNVLIVVAVIGLSAFFGGEDEPFTIGYVDEAGFAVVDAAASAGAATDVRIEAEQVRAAAVRAGVEDGSLDAAVVDGGIVAKEEPPDELLTVLQAANGQVSAAQALERAGVPESRAQEILAPRPLALSTLEVVDPDEEEKAGLTFFIVLILYGQLLTYGYWVAAGVVEEKASRVVEVVLSTIRPAHLLAGKVIGLGLLGLGNLLLIGAIGVGMAAASGALDVDGTVLSAVGLALAWFVVGYAFYACAFACAGAVVSRQEDLQSTMTPLTLIILVSFFLAFAVSANPDGTLATITAFVPMTAPMTMPARIVTGDAATWEIVASYLVTAAGAALLIPVAARIYAGGILRTGSQLKLREAWRAARS